MEQESRRKEKQASLHDVKFTCEVSELNSEILDVGQNFYLCTVFPLSENTTQYHQICPLPDFLKIIIHGISN